MLTQSLCRSIQPTELQHSLETPHLHLVIQHLHLFIQPQSVQDPHSRKNCHHTVYQSAQKQARLSNLSRNWRHEERTKQLHIHAEKCSPTDLFFCVAKIRNRTMIVQFIQHLASLLKLVLNTFQKNCQCSHNKSPDNYSHTVLTHKPLNASLYVPSATTSSHWHTSSTDHCSGGLESVKKGGKCMVLLLP